MLSPSWRKIARDLWIDRTRTFLVVAAIALGVFSIGFTLSSFAILARDLNANYLNTNPASATLVTRNVDDSLIQSVEGLSSIRSAEARSKVVGRVRVKKDTWRPIFLFVLQDYADIRLDKVERQRGAWPPDDGTILIERSALPIVDKDIGDRVTVRVGGGRQRSLKITGVTHAPGLPPGWMDGIAYGYITQDTLSKLGQAPGFNELKIVAATDPMSEKHVRQVAYRTKRWLQARGYEVSRIEIPKPGEHPNNDPMLTMMVLLGAFGLLTVVLGAILTANMISALLSRQIRQIGVMKAIGAGSGRITRLYLGGVLVLGLAALSFSVPLGLWAGRAFARSTTTIFNFDLLSGQVPLWVLAVQIMVGLLIPLLAAVYPVYRGSRLTVREAIGDYGLADRGSKPQDYGGRFGRFRSRNRPLLLAIRNTFRRRGRLALTLGTLAAGGAVFMAAMNIAAAWDSTIDSAFGDQRYDIEVRFKRPYDRELIERRLSRVTGVTRVESWGQATAALVRADGTEGDRFNILAPPSETDLARFPVVEGRQLRPGDTNALVATPGALGVEPRLRVGKTVTLNIEGRRRSWRVVGLVREIGSLPAIYVPDDYFMKVTGSRGQAREIKVVTAGHTISDQQATGRRLERVLADGKFDVMFTMSMAVKRKVLADHIQITIFLLMIMSILSAVVGGLGLASTMSMNVLERRREFAVMQAIGAKSQAILKIVIVEGLIVGVLSWIIAVAISIPLGLAAGNVTGSVLINAPVDFVVSPTAMLIWLGITIAGSAVAAFSPAQAAARLTIRQALAYE